MCVRTTDPAVADFIHSSGLGGMQHSLKQVKTNDLMLFTEVDIRAAPEIEFRK